VAWIERTAYPRLSGSPSARELAEVFTPSADELAWVQARTISEHHRLALLVLLLCYKRLGFSAAPRPRRRQADAAPRPRRRQASNGAPCAG
jgi:hypothetical protein